ncbi:glycerophosphoinositol inositolphosphodiesterase GDPD2 isoform X2 [Microcaecilia unicolor]|uniref:Glycerophosphoinositol inositolphosphodiesterase GDPD2 isoform X2 n=1 Tax=Microcaecilia unicolor TaxID=1415580 RepID=A0A6P7YKJ7_9AMPH|nr:glycerophosphoinositol inositolphosphodiesterase GDPD2 isoform X2 [Microcaecilia unicolor]
MAFDCDCDHFCGTCFAGFYSCQWTDSKKHRGSKCCNGFWFILTLFTFLFTLVWLYVVLITLNDFHNFNEQLFRNHGVWMDWSLIFIILASTLVTYSSLLLLLSFGLILCRKPLNLHWLHKILLILTAVIVAACIVGLDLKWKEEWLAIYISLQATAPFLHLGAAAGVTLLAWVIASFFFHTEQKALRVFVLLLYLCVVIALYLLPLLIHSPCIMEPTHLPPKPRLMGHRGAPMVAPENTMMSFKKTVACDAYAFESDVRVSSDGFPFLMHDKTLDRTTNVATVFPGREKEDSSLFTWAELQQLDAGTWFLQKQPFPAARTLSSEDREEVGKQKIPALSELLEAAGTHNMSVIFDLRAPPKNHNYSEAFVNVTLEAILKSNISQELILWLPDQFREDVMRQAPGFQQIYGHKRRNDTEPLKRVNLSFKNMSTQEIRVYRKDVKVNLYVVDKPWLFSMLWCAGVDSVTTNACHILQQLKQPSWLLPPDTYRMIWIVVDCLLFTVILWAFILQRKCSRKRDTSDTAVLLTQIHSILE